MTSLVVFGAGGRAGRRIVAEAARRGIEATAVVRDPARHPHISGVLRAGDATDADSVAAVASGHDIAAVAVYSADLDPQRYAEATRELLQGLERAGVRRLLLVGLATTARVEGTSHRLFEAPDFPAEWRPFSQARADELAVLEEYDGPVDWVVFTPPMELTDDEGDSRYQIGNVGKRLTYAALAAAILDEAAANVQHRAPLTVTGA